MKGLIVKDFLMFRKSLIPILIFVVIFALAGIFGVLSVSIAMPLFLAVFQVSFMNADEMSHWQQYSIALPYSRKNIVTSKYVVALVIAVVSTVFVSGLYGLSAVIGNTEFSAYGFLTVVVCSLVTGVFYSMLMIPLILKFNSQKGRAVMMIINGAVCGFSVVIMDDDVLESLIWLNSEVLFMPLIVLAVVAVLFVLSWQLSVKIYEKRDF